ncbi:UNVERIFIED_CONTAM: hypothetical protein PYX00_001720 [Menopon gallinae]|uniref:EF-hand domain-containing protein n=2 Tax=Menopon gallinae TaxID=328185 RepID=A0AAW2IE68_9NEOP
MNYVAVLSLLCLIFHFATAPPPRRNEHEETKQERQEKEDIGDFGLEYNRYLREVVDLLESDPEFKKKLEDAQEADIRSGKIAQELEFVDHKVRTKLDEVKRQELERLRHLAQKQYELNNGIDTEHMKVSSEHLDHENPHTFEMEDLKKLIAKVSADLVKADEKRRQEFKEYEMQKEFEKQEKLKHLQGSEREAFEKQIQENETKHKQHEPLHHPGSKQQLEEVWEKQDHMENQEFDPKVFFQLHDLDGNGFWDQNEVKTLFLKELDKMYEQGAPEDDMRERAEEMERMREHVFSEADKNRDGLISYEEFLEKTKQPDFEKDPGWESLDQKPVYTYEEYKEFERKRHEEVQKLIQQGLYHQPHLQGQMPQGHHPAQMAQGYPNQAYNQNQFQGNYQNPGHHNQAQNHPQQQQNQQLNQNQQYQANYQDAGHRNDAQINQQQHQNQQYQQQNYQDAGYQNRPQNQQHQNQQFQQNHQVPQNYQQQQQPSYDQHQANYNNQNNQEYNQQKQFGQQQVSQGFQDSSRNVASNQQPSNVDSNPSKTGTFQKAHAELDHNSKDAKQAAPQSMNHL